MCMSWHDLRMDGLERHAALLAEAARRRRARVPRTSVRERLASALIALGQSIAPVRPVLDHVVSAGGTGARTSCGQLCADAHSASLGPIAWDGAAERRGGHRVRLPGAQYEESVERS
jgi:hypothetical protein